MVVRAILAVFLLVVLTGMACAQEVTSLIGTLEKIDADSSVYLAIKLDKPLKAQSIGGPVILETVQIAGLDQEQWAKAAALVGERISASGRLMDAETRYHHTAMLLLTQQPPKKSE